MTAAATGQISVVASVASTRALQPMLVAITAADVDPLQSIGCPCPAPAVVIIGGVDIGRANECKAVEAMMEEAAVVECESRKPGRESCMRKIPASTHAAPVRTAPMCGGEACASASTHPAPVCAAEVCASAHAAEMHSAATEVPTSEAAAMATASPPRARAGDAKVSAVPSTPATRQLRSLLLIPCLRDLNCRDRSRGNYKPNNPPPLND